MCSRVTNSRENLRFEIIPGEESNRIIVCLTIPPELSTKVAQTRQARNSEQLNFYISVTKCLHVSIYFESGICH